MSALCAADETSGSERQTYRDDIQSYGMDERHQDALAAVWVVSMGRNEEKQFGLTIAAWIAAAAAAGALVAESLHKEPDTFRTTPTDAGQLDAMGALDQ